MRAMNMPDPVKTKSNRLHDTKYLLKQYRSVEYSIRLSKSDLEDRSKSEYGVALSTLRTNAELAGMDLSNTKIESYTRSVMRSMQMLEIINRALLAIKDHPMHGERMYYTVYFTFVSKKRYPSREAILKEIDELGYHMSVTSYHRYLNLGIRELDRLLWGYTSADCVEIMNSFLKKDEDKANI